MSTTRARFILVVVLALLASLVPLAPPAAQADHGLPPMDPSKMDYTPIGYYGPPDEAGTPEGESAIMPAPKAGPPGPPPLGINNPNPSGKWVAYDTNVWESLTFPSRHPGDNCNSIPEEERPGTCEEGDLDPDDDGPAAQGYQGPGGVSTVHGQCPASPDPRFFAGECFNSQLEWLDYYEASMEEMLADFGVVVHRYPFHSPGRSDAGTGRGGYLDAAGGQAYNISATIPGADHPEQTVLVSGHYDFTDSGPAAAWDSAEGHTEVMRMAWLMANYWRQTGTRPSATIKFIPWDSEESGTFGSLDYVENNIPPGEEDKVRGYFNVDPCAGAYPAYYHGDPALGRIPEVMQLADPAGFPAGSPERARIEVFNERAEEIVDEVFEYLDDTITVAPGVEEPIFVSDDEADAGTDGEREVDGSQRDEIVTAVGGLLLFSSDYANFEAAGIPIFNLFPDVFGPHADGTPASPEGISILHTPRDNLTTINALTNSDQTGLTASEGWAKGMEMCAQIESWYMLQPEMAGAQTTNGAPVAYYEALPNEAAPNDPVTFDASGSYQYENPATRQLVPTSQLQFTWDFGDGTSGTGKVVEHSYANLGRYPTTLTVTGPNGQSDTMHLPVEVAAVGAPVLEDIDDEDAQDGDFPLEWTYNGPTEGFEHFSVEESSDFNALFVDDAEGNIADNWEVEVQGDPEQADGVEPWQASDSATPKGRMNQNHSGNRSWWTGVSPQNWNPSPLNVLSIMTTKEPISVPSAGDSELSFWSLFQNEGDDQGRIEVAVDDGDPDTEPVWQTMKVLRPPPTAVGDPHEPLICNPAEPETFLEDLRHEQVNLHRFKGKDVLVRFVYRLGPENRAASQPCGWYVDDIRLSSATWHQIGTTTENTFQVTGKAIGTYAYRVTAIFEDDIEGAPSNTERAEVTTPGGGAECPGKASQRGNHVVGTPGRDVLVGTPGRDVICGRGGNDTIRAKGGNDELFGGPGKDVIKAGPGRDGAKGGAGADTIRGAKGADDLKGSKGDDGLFGQAGPDALKGGAGIDLCRGGPGRDEIKGCER